MEIFRDHGEFLCWVGAIWASQNFLLADYPCAIGRVDGMGPNLRETVRPAPPKVPKREDPLGEAIRERHDSRRTEVAWVMGYRQFGGALPRLPLG